MQHGRGWAVMQIVVRRNDGGERVGWVCYPPEAVPVAAPAVPVVEPPKTDVKAERSLLQRVGELESAKARLDERKGRIVELDQQKAKLLSEIAAIDAESLRLVEEDERDTEAYEAAEILASLEKLFKKG